MVYTEPVCMSIVFDILKLKNRPLIICDLLFSIKNFKKSTWDSIMLHLCMYKTRVYTCFKSLGFKRPAGCVSIMAIFLFLDLFSSVQFLSCVQLFVTPWTVAHQASLFITNSWSLLKLMSIELVMPSNHLILCHPLLLLPLIFASIRVFSNESVLCLRWPKYWPKYSFIGKSKILGSSFSESKFVSLLLLSFFCLLETWNKTVLSYYVEIFCMSPLYSWSSILISTFFT